MVDPWSHDKTIPFCSDIGDDICPVTAAFAGRECGAEESVVSVSKNRIKAKNYAGGPPALVLCGEILVRLASSAVLCPAQDCSGLVEEAIP